METFSDFIQDFVESPGYSSGFYHSATCIPDETEKVLYNHYKQLQPYPPTVIEAIRDIREEELNVEGTSNYNYYNVKIVEFHPYFANQVLNDVQCTI